MINKKRNLANLVNHVGGLKSECIGLRGRHDASTGKAVAGLNPAGSFLS